jgi:hypothetical protein
MRNEILRLLRIQRMKFSAYWEFAEFVFDLRKNLAFAYAAWNGPNTNM